MNFEIQQLKKEHLEYIDNFVSKAITKNFKNEGLTSNEDKWVRDGVISNLKAKYRKILNKHGFGFCIVAIYNNIPVGTIGYSKVNDEVYSFAKRLDPNIKRKDLLEMTLGYVDPEMHNKGIARKLINYISLLLKQNHPEKKYIMYTGFKDTIPKWQKVFGPESLLLKGYYHDGSDCYIWMFDNLEFIIDEKDELVDWVDNDDNRIGIVSKKDAHCDKKYRHREISVGIFNKNKDKVLLQKRSIKKKISPLKWKISVAGHVMFDEDPKEAAKRELKEELGFETRLQFEFKHLYTDVTVNESRIYLVFSGIVDHRNIRVLIDTEEVEETKWVNISEIDKYLEVDEPSYKFITRLSQTI